MYALLISICLNATRISFEMGGKKNKHLIDAMHTKGGKNVFDEKKKIDRRNMNFYYESK